MLILTRNVGETIRIGDDIEISIADVRGGAVRVSIKAPREVKIYREEVYLRVAEANALAAQVSANALNAVTASLAREPQAPETGSSPDTSTDHGAGLSE